jgi:hypothetical protein
VELGEKNNSYFLGLEKKRQAKKSINKLKDENGDIICEQTKLLKEIKRYSLFRTSVKIYLSLFQNTL